MNSTGFDFSQVLDKLLLYLRIVHSLDYYNTCEYPNEDEMPNRCGIIHVRGPMPPNRISHGEGGLPATPESPLVSLSQLPLVVDVFWEQCLPSLAFFFPPSLNILK